LALIGAGARPADAQDATAPGGVQFLVTPYLWLAGINTTIQTPLERAPTVNSNVSAIDLLSHLSAVPFMGSIEIRDGPLGLLGDALHVPVSTNITTRNVFFNGGNAKLVPTRGPRCCSTASSSSRPNTPIWESASAPGRLPRT
jgi:hypothetical protein